MEGLGSEAEAISQKLADEVMVVVERLGLSGKLFYKRLTAVNRNCFFDSIFQWMSDPANNFTVNFIVVSCHGLRQIVVDFVEGFEGNDMFFAMIILFIDGLGPLFPT